jgi:hypothetical protein
MRQCNDCNLHSYCAPEQARAQVGTVGGFSGGSSYGAAADMYAVYIRCAMCTVMRIE